MVHDENGITLPCRPLVNCAYFDFLKEKQTKNNKTKEKQQKESQRCSFHTCLYAEMGGLLYHLQA